MGFPELLKKASLVGAFFVSVSAVLPSLAACPAPSQSLHTVEVSRVVDGDTLRLADGSSVRLIGLNAPELGRDGRPTEAFAEAARRRLEALVAASDGRVMVQPGREAKDRYGRTLANVFDSRGLNLEERLLAEGLGYQVAIGPNDRLLVCQQAAERVARASGLGLWRKAPVRTPAQLKAAGFTLVRSRVRRLEHNRGGLWIELDGPLVLRIEPKWIAQFDPAALEALVGRQVEVRGWVVDRARHAAHKSGQARWLLAVSHPAMLQALP